MPEDKGLHSGGRPKARRFRGHWLALGPRLRAFRTRYGVTRAGVVRAVGADGHSTVVEWESGVNVPEGLRRERLRELLDGERWTELRVAAIAGEGLPDPSTPPDLSMRHRYEP